MKYQQEQMQARRARDQLLIISSPYEYILPCIFRITSTDWKAFGNMLDQYQDEAKIEYVRYDGHGGDIHMINLWELYKECKLVEVDPDPLVLNFITKIEKPDFLNELYSWVESTLGMDRKINELEFITELRSWANRVPVRQPATKRLTTYYPRR